MNEPEIGVGLRLHRHGVGDMLVFREVDLCVRPGELVALVGETGAGKTTLLHLLAGLTTPEVGRAGAAGPIAFVPQDRWFVPRWTGAENIAVCGPVGEEPVSYTHLTLPTKA